MNMFGLNKIFDVQQTWCPILSVGVLQELIDRSKGDISCADLVASILKEAFDWIIKSMPFAAHSKVPGTLMLSTSSISSRSIAVNQGTFVLKPTRLC